MSNKLDESFVVQAIRNELEARIKNAIDDEFAGLTKKIEKRIKSEVAVIACSILKEYDVIGNADNIMITVKNEALK